MTKKVFYVLMALCISVLGFSCRKKKVDDNIEREKKNQKELEAHDVKTLELEVTKFGAWLWINFEKGSAVNSGMTVDQAVESDAWDLGVNRVYFKTNGGKSGKGKGAAFHTDPLIKEKADQKDVRKGEERTEGVKLWMYKKRPAESDWVADTEEYYNNKPYEGEGMNYGSFEKTGLNLALSTTYNNPQEFFGGYKRLGIAGFVPGMPPKALVDESIFFVRCANGKVAMCRLRNGQKAQGQSNSFSSIKYKLDYIYPVE